MTKRITFIISDELYKKLQSFRAEKIKITGDNISTTGVIIQALEKYLR
jgi:hypothetical protein